MLEAYRRWICIGFQSAEKPLTELWLGLGTESVYRPAIKAGLLEWIDGPPQKRILGWVKLTCKGQEVIRQFAARGVGAADFKDFDFVAWDKIRDLLS